MSESQRIPYGRQWITDDDVRAVGEALRSDWLTCGPRVKQFEDAMAAYCGAKHAIAVCNGTAALHVACLALGVTSGQVGVTSPLTFLASANGIAYCGGRPDFVDIDPATGCLSPAALEAFIQQHGSPSVVIPVDFAGVPADLPRFRQLADRHGFTLIEDAAHSLGGRYRSGEHWFRCGCAAHTELAILSFHPVKTLTTGEGGMVLTNDAALARRVRMFANHGTERDASCFQPWGVDNRTGQTTPADAPDGSKPAWLYQQQLLGYNYRITDIQCALGLSQFARLDSFIERRRQIVRTYNEAFSAHAGLRLPAWPASTEPTHHLYVLGLRSTAAAERLRLFEFLKARHILCQVHYIPVHLQPWYRETFGYAVGKCPEAEAFYDGSLSLPLFPALSDPEVAHVISAVGEGLASLQDR